MKTRLYILHKLPTPYNDDLFRALHAADDIDLQVFHLWRGSDRRPWKQALGEGYPNYYMQPRRGIDKHSLRQAWTDKDSVYIVGDWAHAPTLALILARIARGAPVALWTDTPQEQLPRPLLKRIPRARFLRWLLRNVDFTLGSGKPARRVLLEMGAPSEKIVDFQFLVDLDRPEKARNNAAQVERARRLRNAVGADGDGMVLAMSGTIDLKKKAQDLGLRAFAKAREASNIPLGLLVAGAGEQLPALEKLAEELGIADSVAFLGWQEPLEMDSLYLASDVLLHPANYDPFPLVVLESMSFGCAVIGSRECGSVEERVQDGVNGYSFPAGDIEAMTQHIVRLANDPMHLGSTKLEARKTAETWPMSRGVDIIRKTMDVMLQGRS